MGFSPAAVLSGLTNRIAASKAFGEVVEQKDIPSAGVAGSDQPAQGFLQNLGGFLGNVGTSFMDNLKSERGAAMIDPLVQRQLALEKADEREKGRIQATKIMNTEKFKLLMARMKEGALKQQVELAKLNEKKADKLSETFELAERMTNMGLELPPEVAERMQKALTKQLPDFDAEETPGARGGSPQTSTPDPNTSTYQQMGGIDPDIISLLSQINGTEPPADPSTPPIASSPQTKTSPAGSTQNPPAPTGAVPTTGSDPLAAGIESALSGGGAPAFEPPKGVTTYPLSSAFSSAPDPVSQALGVGSMSNVPLLPEGVNRQIKAQQQWRDLGFTSTKEMADLTAIEKVIPNLKLYLQSPTGHVLAEKIRSIGSLEPFGNNNGFERNIVRREDVIKFINDRVKAAQKRRGK